LTALGERGKMTDSACEVFYMLSMVQHDSVAQPILTLTIPTLTILTLTILMFGSRV